MRMLRPPSPNAHLSKLERCGSAELLGILEQSQKSGSINTPYGPLAAVWGRLFSELFLSAEELIDNFDREEHRLSDHHERMLKDLIRADCAGGGPFILDVIKSGGKIDRTALIFYADMEDLLGVESSGKAALLLLIEVCDRRVRPVLIRKAGTRLREYDRRGIPLIFSIFGLCDLGTEDLDAIASVFSDEDLRMIMSRSRTGKTAFEEFMNVSAQIRRYNTRERNAMMERNAFYIPAQKDASEHEPEQPVRIRTLTHIPRKGRKQ